MDKTEMLAKIEQALIAGGICDVEMSEDKTAIFINDDDGNSFAVTVEPF